MTVVMEDVGKSFGGPTPVLEDVSVRIEPGETEFTRTPAAAWSSAMARVSAWIAPLLAT